MSLIDSASLIVTPNAYKEGTLYSVIPSDGSGNLSVTRATTATRVNSAGLVELVPYNFIRYSQDFTNGAWDKLGTALTVTGNTTIAPDGTLTADTLNVSNNDNVLYQANSSGFAFTGNTYTFSIYAKGTGTFDMRVRLNSATTTSQVKTLTNEWQRFDVSVTNSVAVTSIESYIILNTSSTYFVWGAQLVEGSVAKDYQKTETRLNIPRLDYSNGTCPSILVEPQRTNLLTYSSSFDNAAWGKLNTTISANSAISPSGIQDADTLTASGGTALHTCFWPTSLFGANHTISVYAKKNTNNFLQIYTDFVNTDYANFDLNNGVVGSVGSTVISSSIESVGNGWYRCSFVTGASASQYVNFSIISSATSPRTESNALTTSVFIWGAQLEAGSYATSYIPTTSASVTRNADVISKTGISSIIGQTEGVIFYDFILSTTGVDFTLGNLYSSSNANSFSLFYINPSNQIGVSLTNNGVTQCEIVTSSLSLGRHKIAFAYKANDFAVYIDGALQGTDTSGSVPNMDSFNMVNFNLAPNAYRQEVNIYASALWKTRLTNDELERLTGVGFNTYTEMANYYNYITQ